jgi:hypothetical protein
MHCFKVVGPSRKRDPHVLESGVQGQRQPIHSKLVSVVRSLDL